MAAYYCKPSASGTGDGSSWANAFSMATAGATAGSSDEVYCSSVDGDFAGPIPEVAGVMWYGGFDSSASETPATRDLVANGHTNIDGANANGFLTKAGGNNTYDGFRAYDCARDASFGFFFFWASSAGTLTLRNCILDDGPARGSAFGSYGGATGTTLVLENVLCAANTTFNILHTENDLVVTVDNCTFSGENGSPTEAVTANGTTSFTARNSIFYGNFSTGGSALRATGSASITATYCDVEGGFTGAGNVDVDPDFVGSGDFSLGSTSPCIGAGDSGTALATDILLVARDAAPDMGAYEFVAVPAQVGVGLTDSAGVAVAIRDRLGVAVGGTGSAGVGVGVRGRVGVAAGLTDSVGVALGLRERVATAVGLTDSAGVALALRERTGVAAGLTESAGVGVAPTERDALVPQGFGWDFGTYPIGTVKVDGPGTAYLETPYPIESHFAAALSGPTYHVDVTRPNDSGSGLATDYSDAKRSIHAAITAGNATLAPYNVKVLAGVYPRHRSFASEASNVHPTQPVVIKADGVVYAGAFDQAFSWSATPTSGTLYTASRSAVQGLFDRLDLDGYGNPARFVYYGSGAGAVAAADASSGVNAWAQDGGTLYAKRADAAAPTHGNTFTTLNSVVNFYNSAGVPALLTGVDVGAGDGFEMIGGAGGCFRNTSAGSGVVGAVNAAFRCTGGPLDYAGGRGAAIDNWDGLAYFQDCIASGSNDGINAHRNGGTGPTHLLTVGCVGPNNGLGTSTSNNGLTIHDDVIAIDVNGEYPENKGANIAAIDTSQMWCVGTRSVDAAGDGGSISGVAVQVSGTAKVWIESGLLDEDPGAGAEPGWALVDVGAELRLHLTTTVGTFRGDGFLGSYGAFPAVGGTDSAGVGVALRERVGLAVGFTESAGVALALRERVGLAVGLTESAGVALALRERVGVAAGLTDSAGVGVLGGVAVPQVGVGLTNSAGVGVAIRERTGVAVGGSGSAGVGVAVRERTGVAAGLTESAGVGVLGVGGASQVGVGLTESTGVGVAVRERTGVAVGGSGSAGVGVAVRERTGVAAGLTESSGRVLGVGIVYVAVAVGRTDSAGIARATRIHDPRPADEPPIIDWESGDASPIIDWGSV